MSDYKKEKTGNQIRRERCIEEGRCTSCGKPHNEKGRCCAGCAKKNRDRRNTKRTAHLAKGLCQSCGESPHMEKTRLCIACTIKDKDNKRALYTDRLARGLCRECVKPHNEKGTMCVVCAKKNRIRTRTINADRLARGLCKACGKPHNEKGQCCAGCAKKNRDRINTKRADRAVKNLCLQCGDIKEGPSTLCDKHILIFAAKNNLGHSNKWRELETLFQKQNGICPYSEEVLILGDNASVDHIIPKSKGGLDVIENLQWVTWDVNRAKGDMLHDDFEKFYLRLAKVHEQKRTTWSCP